MLSPPHVSAKVGPPIMFSGCPSAAFVQTDFVTDLVTTISYERLDRFWYNWWQGTFIIPYWCTWFSRSKVKVTAGRRGGEGSHVDAGRRSPRLLVKWWVNILKAANILLRCFDDVGSATEWIIKSGCMTVVERRPLTGELSLCHARPVADWWPLMWVNHPI